MKLAQTEGWLSSSLGEELVMMSIDNGNYVGISRVGARIYEMLKTPSTLDELCARLVEEYNVPLDVCGAEVKAFIDEMMEHGAIRQAP